MSTLREIFVAEEYNTKIPQTSARLLYINVCLKVDLHDTTLSHATSLRQAYDMT